MNVDRRRKMYRLKQSRGIPTNLVPTTEARKHLAALIDLGWSVGALEQQCGLTDQGLLNILRGEHAQMGRRTRAAIMGIPYTLAVPSHLTAATFVPALGAQRRMHALLALGWTRDTIRPHSGGTNIAHVSSNPYGRMHAARWRDVNRAYLALHMKRGPSELGRQRALVRGLAPPLAFDDIDDPNERPNYGNLSGRHKTDIDESLVDRILAGERLPCTIAEKREVVARWTGTLNELERRTGWNVARLNRTEPELEESA